MACFPKRRGKKEKKHVIDAASRLSCQRVLCSRATLIIKQLFIKQKLTLPCDIYHGDTRPCRRSIFGWLCTRSSQWQPGPRAAGASGHSALIVHPLLSNQENALTFFNVFVYVGNWTIAVPFFSFQRPDNYDLQMRYWQLLFHTGAREMRCELCVLCRVSACTANTRPKNYVMASSVQWVLNASVARTMFSAKLGCALSPWQLGGLATVSGKCGGTDFVFLIPAIISLYLWHFNISTVSS